MLLSYLYNDVPREHGASTGHQSGQNGVCSKYIAVWVFPGKLGREGRGGEGRGGEGRGGEGSRFRLKVVAEQETLNEQSPNLLNDGVVCGCNSVVPPVHPPEQSWVLDTNTVKLLLVQPQRAKGAPERGGEGVGQAESAAPTETAKGLVVGMRGQGARHMLASTPCPSQLNPSTL